MVACNTTRRERGRVTPCTLTAKGVGSTISANLSQPAPICHYAHPCLHLGPSHARRLHVNAAPSPHIKFTVSVVPAIREGSTHTQPLSNLPGSGHFLTVQHNADCTVIAQLMRSDTTCSSGHHPSHMHAPHPLHLLVMLGGWLTHAPVQIPPVQTLACTCCARCWQHRRHATSARHIISH